MALFDDVLGKSPIVLRERRLYGQALSQYGIGDDLDTDHGNRNITAQRGGLNTVRHVSDDGAPAVRVQEGTIQFLQRAFHRVWNPGTCYRHANLIHAARISLGILISFAVTAGFQLPHGEWTSVSLLIVMASLQHHGTIRQRGFERSLGTTLGAIAGLAVITQQTWLQLTPLTWVVMAAFCGACAYYAIGRGGYIALLSAITLIIVAGHGTDPIEDSLWRAINVIIGVAIALLLSFALPIYATWFWRYKVADLLRQAAQVWSKLQPGASGGPEAILRELVAVSSLLPQLRTLMPSVVKESGVAPGQLEAVQRSLRIFVSILELLSMDRSATSETDLQRLVSEAVRQDAAEIGARMLATASALESQHPDQSMPGAAHQLHGTVMAADAPPGEDGSLTLRLCTELDRLLAELASMPKLWQV